MNAKEKLLIVGLLLVVALSFFLGHFWSYTVSALQKTVVLDIVPLFVFSRFLAASPLALSALSARDRELARPLANGIRVVGNEKSSKGDSSWDSWNE